MVLTGHVESGSVKSSGMNNHEKNSPTTVLYGGRYMSLTANRYSSTIIAPCFPTDHSTSSLRDVYFS